MNKAFNKEPTVGFVSLGCPKALVDSENIITRLRTEGYQISPSYEGADLVVVNTCGFIDDAIEESLDAIGEAINENGKVIVTGCLGAKGDIVQDNYPNVLAVTGPQATTEVMNAVHKHLPTLQSPYENNVPAQGIKLTPKHYAYLKISEGCNYHCSFCIIPSMRGKLVSRPVDELLEEAKNLVDAGTKELLIVSQDTGAYGVDSRYATRFWQGRPVKTKFQDLVQYLGEMEAWIRLHYVYPYPHIDDIIPMMAEGIILPYLDIPFQHASPSILKAMKRPAHSENNLTRIQKWREICPDITIRSTFIAGFPGETDDDFERLLDFLNEAQLDRVGCFAYSPVDGAAANELANHVPEDVQQDRLERFMAVQEKISANKLKRRIGQRLTVIVDDIEEDAIIARSKADAPEIDGVVILNKLENISVGNFVDVEITNADSHDLYGNIITNT